MTYNVVIIEDEKPAARRMERLAEEQHCRIVATLQSIEQAVKWFSENATPDLIFMDIQLSDGLSFEIFEKTNIVSPIIFTTAYDHYAIKAFKLNSVDYLLKPIDSVEFTKSIEKFKQRFYEKKYNISEEIEKIKLLLFAQKTYKERFTIYLGSSIKLLDVIDIECFTSIERATYAHTFSGKNYLLDDSLEKIYKVLNPKDFFRVNRSQIISLKGILEILNYSNSRIKVKMKVYKNEDIIVSRERVKDFKNWLV